MAKFINPFTDVGFKRIFGQEFSKPLLLDFLTGDCNNDFERWIYVLKNMDTLNRLPWIAQNAVFRRLAEIGEVSALSKEDRIKYDRSLKAFRDAYNTYAWAEKKAMEKGMAEGEEKGKRDNARRMKADGMSAELIAKYTGLSAEVIAEL